MAPPTLLEAEVGDPLDGRAPLLHELVEAEEEGFLLLLLTPGPCFLRRRRLPPRATVPRARRLLQRGN